MPVASACCTSDKAHHKVHAVWCKDIEYECTQLQQLQCRLCCGEASRAGASFAKACLNSHSDMAS